MSKPRDRRWTYHVTALLMIGDRVTHMDSCATINYKLDHEQDIETLRASIVASIRPDVAGPGGALLVGGVPVRCVFTQTPQLVRTFLADEPALVQ